MTDWQWNVILALCRLVLSLHQDQKQGIIPQPADENVKIIREALSRENA